jgi:phage baseplate assembly protein V
MRMIRGIFNSCIEGVVKRFTASGHVGETFTSREYMQHYGFTSRPLEGAEGVLIDAGNHIVMIASEDRRCRVAVEAGEVCIYTDEGDHIRLKRDKEIYIKSGNKLTAEIENEANITTKKLNAEATESAVVRSPLVNLEADSVTMGAYGAGGMSAVITGDITLVGNLDVTGSITATGTIMDAEGNTNHHSH